MKYCTKCLLPDTKPDLTFNKDGVCSACTAYEERKLTNWLDRERQFIKLVDQTKKKTKELNRHYDCIVPVSGGKDSHYQALKCREYGLNPLLVNAETCHLSELGRRNLKNLVNLGFDLITVSTSGPLRRALNKYCLEHLGDISWPEHVTIFTVPVREAVLRSIDLIVYGENPQNEYGGPDEGSQKATQLDRRWLAEFGGLNGFRVSDAMDKFPQFEEHLWTQYCYPFDTSHIKAIFLGQFFPWDGHDNAELAIKNGFEPYFPCVEGSGFDYENLDNLHTGIHDYYKYIKYGFGRATDICSSRIRRGLMSRNDAIQHVNTWDGEFPLTYLDVPLHEILEPLGMNYDDFVTITKQFVNKELFHILRGPHCVAIDAKFEVK